MGEIKHSIEKIGYGYDHYFLLLAGKYEVNTEISKFFNDNFSLIGSAIGERAVIVRRAKEGKIEKELHSRYSYYNYRNVQNKIIPEVIEAALKDEYSPVLLLSNQHPVQFNETGKIACISYSALEKAYPYKQELLSDLVKLARNNDYAVLTKTMEMDTAENIKRDKGFSISINLGIVSFGINF